MLLRWFWRRVKGWSHTMKCGKSKDFLSDGQTEKCQIDSKKDGIDDFKSHFLGVTSPWSIDFIVFSGYLCDFCDFCVLNKSDLVMLKCKSQTILGWVWPYLIHLHTQLAKELM